MGRWLVEAICGWSSSLCEVEVGRERDIDVETRGRSISITLTPRNEGECELTRGSVIFRTIGMRPYIKNSVFFFH